MADVLGYLSGERKRKEQGIRDLLNMFLMSKQVGEQRKEKEWERGIKEREVTSMEDYRKALTEQASGRRPSIPASLQEAEILRDYYGISMAEALEKRATLGQKLGPTDYQKEMLRLRKTGEQRKILDNAISAYEKRINQLESPMSLSSYLMAEMQGVAPDIKMKPEQVANLNVGLSKLKATRGRLEKQGELLDKDFAEALNLFSRMNVIEKQKGFTEDFDVESGLPTSSFKATLSEDGTKAYFQGQEYDVQEVGGKRFVIINGEEFLIREIK